MPFYESVFIAKQDLTPAQLTDLVGKYTKVITDHSGKIVRQEDWGLRAFTYKIKKNKKGYYTLLHIDAPAEAVLEMQRLMRFDEDVLRSLTVKMDALPEGPSVMMERKKGHDDAEETELV